jgi:hypothetical protein
VQNSYKVYRTNRLVHWQSNKLRDISYAAAVEIVVRALSGSNISC